MGVNGTKRVSHMHMHAPLPPLRAALGIPSSSQPLAHKKIKTLNIISHKCGFEAPSVTRHVPQSVLAPDSWRGLPEDQNDFMLPSTDQGYSECFVWGGELGSRSTQPHPHCAATTPCPGLTRTGAGPENGSRHQ